MNVPGTCLWASPDEIEELEARDVIGDEELQQLEEKEFFDLPTADNVWVSVDDVWVSVDEEKRERQGEWIPEHVDDEELIADGGLVTADGNTPEEFEPAEQYEDYVALLVNGSKQTHIVDPTTFRQSTPPADYEGYSANIGFAESLCGGDERLGRMLPMDSDGANLKQFICGHCLNALEKLEVDDEQ